MMMNANANVITVQDCLDMAEKKGMRAVINDGQIMDFVQEKGASDGESQCAV